MIKAITGSYKGRLGNDAGSFTGSNNRGAKPQKWDNELKNLFGSNSWTGKNFCYYWVFFNECIILNAE